MPDSPRLGWLDGLRGLAAMQVVLLHYISAFLPAMDGIYPLPIQEFWWRGLVTTPFLFLYDGHSAVYLFFIMSGVALTHAFSPQPFAFLATGMRRIIRLGLPMAAAVLLAALLYSLLPDAHVEAGGQTGSPWLRNQGPGEISMASIAHQIAFEGLLAGFDGWTLLPAWMSGPMSLVQNGHAFDSPLWTLHIEFAGSLLIMVLVAVRASARRGAYRATCAILGCAFVLSPMSLFIVGHVVANHLRRTEVRKGHMALGTTILGAGILLCSMRITLPVSMLWKLLPPPPLGIPGDPEVLQKMLGAILVFGGIALLPAVQRQLKRPGVRWLGRISFSLYLVHFPLEFTFVAAGFTQLERTLPYGAAVAVTTIAGIAASIALAVAFERWIDRPAINLSRLVGRSRERYATPAPLIETA